MPRFNEVTSARDMDGHGTHTASTAAGRVVKGVSLFGLAQGSARGAVPSARIAVYKVCGTLGCPDSSILAAFDDAIADGVDILSISLGPNVASNYSTDSVAIGSFQALLKGILTSQSAGNDGPERGTLNSVAPWVFTVAASSIDRHIVTKAIVGDGTIFMVIKSYYSFFTLPAPFSLKLNLFILAKVLVYSIRLSLVKKRSPNGSWTIVLSF